MARWNKDQWGVQQGQGYPPFSWRGAETRTLSAICAISRSAAGRSSIICKPTITLPGRSVSVEEAGQRHFLSDSAVRLCRAFGNCPLRIRVGSLAQGWWLSCWLVSDPQSTCLYSVICHCNSSYPVHNLPDARPHLYRVLMHITFVLFLILKVTICVYYWTTGYYSVAIIFTIIALFSIFAYFGFRFRIPLASLLLQVVMDVSEHHKSIYVVAFIALILQAALSV